MKLVMIEWTDACSASTMNWMPYEDMGTDEPLNCISVGWLLRRDSHQLVLLPHSYAEDGGPVGKGCGWMAIPAPAVVKVTNLQAVPEDQVEG